MILIRRTRQFDEWLVGVRDGSTRARLAIAIGKLAYGLGDVAPIGEGVSELRLHFGPGYRLYFVRRGDELIVLLCGGTKRRQSADVAEARRLATNIGDDDG